MKKSLSGYRYIFGPVASRRLGISLGVDLVPSKTCTLDCIYCESGQTTCKTLKRDEYVPIQRVKDELNDFLSNKPRLDFITFSGSGEPTLNIGIQEIIDFLKSNYPQYKVALLTNGTLFHNTAVRNNILKADLVKASFDAGSEKLFFDINRPHKDLNFSEIVNGLVAFRKRYHKQYVIEVFFIPKFNDFSGSLKQIKQILGKINPDQVQLNTLDRPGAISNIGPVDPNFLKKASLYLDNAKIIHYSDPDFDPKRETQQIDDMNSIRILSTLKRRPLTAEDITKVTGFDIEKVYYWLENMIKSEKIEKIYLARGIFYTLKR